MNADDLIRSQPRITVLIPSNIKIEFVVSLSPGLLALLQQLLGGDKTQAAVDALAKRLQDVRTAIAASVAANPDPNPND